MMPFAAKAVEVAETSEPVRHYLTDQDVTNAFTAVSGITTIEMFQLIAQLITLGVLLVVVIVICIRKI